MKKALDPGATGWPLCICIISDTAFLVKDSDRRILGQALKVTTPMLLRESLNILLTDGLLMLARLTQYQALLFNPPQ